MSLQTEDFLALEPLILERLKALCPAARAVLSVDDLADVAERSQTAPALHVVYGGFRVNSATDNGRSAVTEQRWLVVAVTRCSAQRSAAPAEARARSGELAREALAALMGWRPVPGMRPLALATPPNPIFRNGMSYIPLAFTALVPVHAPRLED